MSTQDLQRTSGGSFSRPCMVHPDLVPHSSPNVMSTTQVVDLDPPTGTSVASISQSPQHEKQTKTDGLSSVREHYESQGLSEHVTNVLLDSWRPATQQQYAVYFKKWDLFCCARKIPSHSPTLNHVLEFLYTQLHLSYSSLNTAGSALSCFLTINNHPVGKHPLVCRFLKGAFERKPPPTRHYAIWDVKTVLAYLKTFTPNSSLSLKELTHKLVMLLALVSIQRKQTLLHLNINHNYLVKSDNQFVFIVDGHVKQSRPNYSIPPILIPRYSVDPDICPYVCLEDYLERTKNLRQNGTLLIATIKPDHPLGTQTLGRWIKTVLQGAGIDMSLFTPHSTRHASATAAFVADIPIDEILKRAGWSNAMTFKRFYYKSVIE